MNCLTFKGTDKIHFMHHQLNDFIDHTSCLRVLQGAKLKVYKIWPLPVHRRV